MTFHLMSGNISFSSLWDAEWSPFWERAAHSADNICSLLDFDYL